MGSGAGRGGWREGEGEKQRVARGRGGGGEGGDRRGSECGSKANHASGWGARLRDDDDASRPRGMAEEEMGKQAREGGRTTEDSEQRK